MKFHKILLLCALGWCGPASAQMYSGMTGLLHVPSAEMNEEGVARVGAHFVSQEMISRFGYDTFTYYLNITPFKWVEASYTCTALKLHDKGFDGKDRTFNVKVNPLREGRYWPSVVIGGQDIAHSDIFGSGSDSSSSENITTDKPNGYYSNYYVAATKHFTAGGNEFSASVAYRYYVEDWNKRYEGVVGGLSFRPGFAPYSRLIAEYDGDGVNVGVDALLFKHCLVQVATGHFKCLQAGVAFQLNLLGRNKNLPTSR